MFVELVKRDNTFVLVTAEHLKHTALNLGAKPDKIIDNKNGVILEDFTKIVEPAQEVQKIKSKGKPIVGYYGALTATWFDFDLVSNLVERHPEYEFILIGLIYPDANVEKTNEYIDKLKQHDNFTYIPPIHYNEIPKYAKSWDVATIPFRINDITLSTSPVTLFEYMAMGLSIVTTPMPECKLYESVFVADSSEDFENKIKIAISQKENTEYQKKLQREASENTWNKRVEDIISIIEKNYKG